MSQYGFQSGMMWNTYLEMERQFLEYLDYVPLTADHKKVYSSRLLRLMLQIGGYIDTAFKEIALFQQFDGNASCEEIRKKVLRNRTVPIDLSLKTFEPFYRLSRRSILVKSVEHFAYPPLVIDRFAPFADFREHRIPSWWSAYNAVKHNMVKNIKKANLENTMKALGAAFLLNAIYEPSVICLVRSGEAKLIRISKTGINGQLKHDTFKHDTLSDWKRIDRIISNHQLKKNEYVNLQTRFFLIQYTYGK